jgi:twitching motility protein PilT
MTISPTAFETQATTTIAPSLEVILQLANDLSASDVHLSINCFPTFRISGELVPQNSLSLLTEENLLAMCVFTCNERQHKHLMENHSVDLAFTSQKNLRYRVNVYFELGTPAFAIRWLDGTFHSMSALRLPSQLSKLAQLKDGLVLVTGATGSGKSTTLASIINEINQHRACHILTIEDPVEFIHFNKKAMIHQREIGRDVNSFSDAIRSAMREDPDVILLGEMRDTETMMAALMAAETGHLVFSTLHTNDAVGVIDRLVGAFSGDEQSGVRQQLSMVLRAVVTQTLLRPDNSSGRVPVNEILMVNTAVANLIRNHKPEQIYSIMEAGRSLGNQTYDFALAQRVKEKLISREQGLRSARKPHAFNELVNQLLSTVGTI